MSRRGGFKLVPSIVLFISYMDCIGAMGARLSRRGAVYIVKRGQICVRSDAILPSLYRQLRLWCFSSFSL
jgi:hypothetical protein